MHMCATFGACCGEALDQLKATAGMFSLCNNIMESGLRVFKDSGFGPQARGFAFEGLGQLEAVYV